MYFEHGSVASITARFCYIPFVNPGTQSLVREREVARRTHEHLMYSARAEGRVEGEARGKAEDILAIIEARALPVSDEQRRRILECTELGRLGAWVRKAVTLTDVDELFAQ